MNKLRNTKGDVQEIKGGGCLGHWKPLEVHKLHPNIPWALEFKDDECKDLALISTIVARDPDPPNDECYFFYCYDITLGPSDELRIWKVEPKVAARVFGGMLNGHYDQRIIRVGTDYRPGPINNKATKSKGT